LADVDRGSRVCLVVNPRSAGGATGRRLTELREVAARYFDDVDVRLTARPGEGAVHARDALGAGHRLIVAVGGDGTAHELVNGLVGDDRAVPAGVDAAVIPAGTGSDLVRTLGMPSDLDEAMSTVRYGEARRMDLTWVSLRHADRRDAVMVGVNVTGFGLNGDVVRLANQAEKRLGATVTFVGSVARALVGFRPPVVRVAWTDAAGEKGAWEGELLAAFVANGGWCGGGMHVGKGGSPLDGVLELTLVKPMPLRRVARGLQALYRGDAEQVDGVVRVPVTAVRATSTRLHDVRVDVDGEQPGTLPLSVRVLPAALSVRGVWPPA
jgi:diacylglycerol kinase (ATP)